MVVLDLLTALLDNQSARRRAEASFTRGRNIGRARFECEPNIDKEPDLVGETSLRRTFRTATSRTNREHRKLEAHALLEKASPERILTRGR